ncbi:hypothetical protein PCC7424_4154 [Gloeothece citriformis PCC 7424]|uniref:Uncharacterized protein n=1 Tax=Gloeothece citriformis (strain PCC 7424) TaxID=65393 RepID=B7KLF3_GLOC7|nr:hypothetical protein [Gloeothece citriformis]ACK72525.1 hypothetical protein PCC7424_4154 [Gloeothece citriformis PCC 7424]
MSSNNSQIFWLDSTRSRYFLIPEGENISPGDFTLCNLIGEKKNVSLTEIFSFEVSELDAKIYLENLLKKNRELAQKDLLQRLKDSSLTTTLEALQNQPEEAKMAFENFYNSLKEIVNDSTSNNPSQVESVGIYLDSFRQLLKNQDIKIKEEIEKELPEKIRELFSLEEIDRYIPKVINKLRELAQEIENNPELGLKKIDEAINTLSQDLLLEEEKRLDTKRKQEYKKSAKKAIAQSFKSLNLPSFAGGDFTLKNNLQKKDED